MTSKLMACLGVILLVCGMAGAQDALDGPKHVFQDPLLDNMTGAWRMSGKIVGQDVSHTIEAEWVLNHQFMRIHEKDTAPAKEGQPGYEAMVMLGYDNASERYVAHWTDIYGGRFSETLGYGKRTGDEIEFVFEYPDGPFHTTFRWKPDTRSWQWQMRGKNQKGEWFDFSDLSLKRAQ